MAANIGIAAQTPPHGYRSAVAYDATTKTWVTVGRNGTDISTNDGKNWRALEPKLGQPAGADKIGTPSRCSSSWPQRSLGKLRDDAPKP
jgi:hypothetical protein